MRTPIKVLIFSTIGLSLLAVLVPELQMLLALSWVGIKNYYYWQVLTYAFITPGSVSVGFFFQLGFNMYVLWMFGTSLLERTQAKLFLTLYLGAIILPGLSVLAIPNAVLAGSTTAVYAILVAWMMLNSGARLLLFFTIPFKAQWLVVGLIAFTLFVNISSHYWVGAISLTASILYSYLFTLIVWKQLGPFPILHPFERRFLSLFEKKVKQPKQRTKIFDIKSGSPVLNDDQFMDAMLEKISTRGKESLSPEEKKRMKEISERKK
ncbi:MAG: hypothetical protein COT85_01395 [Chlamydiae bacterium CG10_big_fil_rev_8_21_14_0_10_42_34]|nr:MAG: hypothetical protein COT85_01395 [Chlamydiae bacterium CG10_big_fil_rev_8_21_14_0_10_42_34]